MSETENAGGQDKSEDPTPKRKQDAHEKGQVPRSRELNTSLVLLASALLLLNQGDRIGAGLASVMRQGLIVDRAVLFDNERFSLAIFSKALIDAFALFVPFILVLLFVVLVTPALIGGWSFSTKAVAPKFSRINPMAGFKRMFSVNGLLELCKATLKVALVGAVAAQYIYSTSDKLIGMSSFEYSVAISLSLEMIGSLFLILSLSTLLIAAIDVPFQLWHHKKQIKMSRHEVKDESKQTEGDPEIKSRIRRLQLEASKRRMMVELPKADVVITNPSHYAVALKYDDKNMKAPMVIAKGVDLVALRIRELAAAHKIPLYEAPPLARALFYSTDLNREIPVGLYYAVAQVLAYIFQLRVSTKTDQKPTKPISIDVPDEYSHHPTKHSP